MARRNRKISRWMLFIVGIAFVPILLRVIFEILERRSISFESLFGGGELLLVAVAIAADGASELVGLKAKRGWENFALYSCFSCIFIIIVASAVYGQCASSSEQVDQSLVAFGSMWATVFSVAAGVSCKIASGAS